LEKMLALAKIKKVTLSLKNSILKAIKKAEQNNGRQVNVIDHHSNVSYVITVSRDTKKEIPVLIVSVVDYGPVPNASILPFLKEKFGEPTTIHAKPWIQDNAATFLIMYWENPNFNLI